MRLPKQTGHLPHSLRYHPAGASHLSVVGLWLNFSLARATDGREDNTILPNL
jgi:hypothetical protein